MTTPFLQGFEEVGRDLEVQLKKLEHPATPKTREVQGKMLALKAAVQGISEWNPTEGGSDGIEVVQL